MEASETYQADKKALQAAVKDLNNILAPKPKLNFIASIENLSRQIIDTLGACVGEDEAGNPIWTRPDEVAKLNQATIALYNDLVAREDAGDVEEDAEPKPSPHLALAEAPVEGECQAFLKSAGPKEGDPECAECKRLQECIDKLTAAQAKAAISGGCRAVGQADQYQQCRHLG